MSNQPKLKIRTGEEASRIAIAVRDGVQQEDGTFIKLTPEQEATAMAALRQYAAERQEALDFQEAQRDPETGELPAKPITKVFDPTANADPGSPVEDVLRRSGGAIQAAITMATGAMAEPGAGAAGLATGILTGGNTDAAAAVIADVQDALTFDPVTDTGAEMLQGVLKPLAKIEEGVDWVASNASLGNPFAASMIKTSMLGGLEIAGMRGAQRVRIPKKLKEIQDQAAELGIQLDANNMQSSIIEAAERMTPTERAANAGFLQEAMRQAAAESQKAVAAQFDRAREGRAFVNVKDVNQLAGHMAKELQEQGFDFRSAGMKDIVQQLDDLTNMGTSQRPGTIVDRQGRPFSGTERLTQRVQDVETIRRRLVRLGRSQDPNVRGAANRMKGMMDDWMDHQLAEGLIGGDPAVIKLWKDARIAHTDYMRNFKEDRMIKNLIEKEATPEQVRAWIMGMSAIGAKANAATTINRMKQVLGDSHPAIEGIRQDMLFEIAAPLLKDKPNFGQFIANYDKLIGNNPSLVKSLGLDQGSMRQLRDFAVTAEKMGPNPSVFNQGLLVRGLATFFVGHNLARKALKVNLARNIGSMLFGVDRVTQRAILADLTGAAYGKPILPRNGPAAALFIASNSLSIADDTIQKRKDEAQEAARKAAEGHPVL